MARTIKDVFCRYKTMQGFQVKRKAGWDTHGLPVELGVEKELGITKEDIGKSISIEDYNARCRQNVMKFTQEWTDLSHLMGYWVDMEHPYITYETLTSKRFGGFSDNFTRRDFFIRATLFNPTLRQLVRDLAHMS